MVFKMFNVKNCVHFTFFCYVLIAVTLMALPFDDSLGPPATKLPEETCYFEGEPYIMFFPRLYNCTTFWFCAEKEPGIPFATEQPCPAYETEGRLELLTWNFVTCECDYPWNTQCYDMYNTTHSHYRLNCARKLFNSSRPRDDDY